MNYSCRNMKKDKLTNMMEQLSPPTARVEEHAKEFRVTLLNTRKSTVAGLLLMLTPLLFLLGVTFKYYLNPNLFVTPVMTFFYDWMMRIDPDSDSSIISWLFRILLVGGPLAAIGINLLAVTHIRLNRSPRELIVAFKLKWLNWLIIAICTLIFLIFFGYLLVENINHPQ